MTTLTKNALIGTVTTLLSTELNSLANNSLVASSVGGSSGVFDFTAGNFAGYQSGIYEINLGAPGSAFSTGAAISIWFLQSIDGTNYEDGSSSVTPARTADVVIPLRATTGAQRVTKIAALPPGSTVKVLLKNDATGQSLNASGNTLKVSPFTDTQV